MSEGELILCSTEDGAAIIGLRVVDGTVWLSQREIAEPGDQCRQNPPPVFAQEALDPCVQPGGGLCHAPGNSWIGRSSTVPYLAPGIIAAYFKAASRSGTSNT